MSSYRVRVGRAAERLAAVHMENLGYGIIQTNYRCSCGEIDIIASDGDTLVFAEVRCKTGSNYGTPAESIDIRKQKKIIAVAENYLATHEIGYKDFRFDVLEVISCDGKLVVKDLIKNAFIGGD